MAELSEGREYVRKMKRKKSKKGNHHHTKKRNCNEKSIGEE